MARLLLAVSCLALLVPVVGAYDEEKDGVNPDGRVRHNLADAGFGGSSYATGSCSLDADQAVVIGRWSFLCGTDRDDDGLITNVDTATNEGGFVVSNDADGWDDDFAIGYGDGIEKVSVPICFRSDLAKVDISGGQGLLFAQDSTSPVNGDGTWDDVMFIIEPRSILSGSIFIGKFTTRLVLNQAAGCGGVNISSHTHG